MEDIVKYLQSFENHFWHYEDIGNVIAVPNGQTIGYSQLVLSEIVLQLAPQGLPRFGSLLIAMAATNSNGVKTLESILNILNLKNSTNNDVIEGISFAKLLTEVPLQYKKGKMRIELLRSIFHDSHNSIGLDRSRRIQSEIKKSIHISNYKGILNKRTKPSGCSFLDFKTLALIGREFKSVDDILAAITGLPSYDVSLEPLDSEEKDETQINPLIEGLINDKNTFHVGALVSRILSGMNIPFHSSLPSEQPLGGVADITNKGSFDKLLISEHAFEDEVQLSRLANNEALYKHREVPPSDNNYNRIIIIDATLKNWGSIRAISFATMLAITNHPKNDNPCRVFIVGKSYEEVAFESVNDIVNAMLIMDVSLDPGAGLMKLFTEEKIEVSEMFYIGNKESLNQPKMIFFNSEYGKRIDHWIHPTAEGVVSFYKNPKRGKRFVQELIIPLDEAWKEEKKIKPRVKDVLRTSKYPILFPAGTKQLSFWQGRKFNYVSTKENSVFRYYGAKNKHLHSGLELIDNNFSNGNRLKAVMTHDDMTVTLLVLEPKRVFSLIWPSSGKRILVDDTFMLYSNWNYKVENEWFVGGSSNASYIIHLDGSVKKDVGGLDVEILRERPHAPTKQVYRNLNKISISKKGLLRIGKHKLQCQNNRLLISYDGKSDPDVIVANVRPNNVYMFRDGSYIKHNRAGMLTLVSSNSDISNVYIPCILGSSLGVATNGVFSGVRYFRNELKYELYFYKPITQKLSITKMVKNELGIHLKNAKYMVDQEVIVSHEEKNLLRLQKSLNALGIVTTMNKIGLNQTEIMPLLFYQEYIHPFINQIVTYES